MKRKTLKDYLDAHTSLGDLRPKIFIHQDSKKDFPLNYHFYELRGKVLDIHDRHQITQVESCEYMNDQETDDYFVSGIIIGMQKAIGNLESGKELDPGIFLFL